MSGCNDEVDQSQNEKRKSIEAATTMGDVLGKESSSKEPNPDDGREEADGAPADNSQTTVNQVTPSNLLR